MTHMKMKMKMKKNRIFFLLILIISALSLTVLADTARDITKECDIVCTGISREKILDGSISTHSKAENITVCITANENIGGIYLKYNNHAPDSGLLDGRTSVAQNGFVHEFIEIDSSNTAELYFPHADICDMYVYSEGELHDDVQKWEIGNPDTDILLLATHSDDDQLFFAGLLPYYAKYRGVNVRVAYFVNHFDTYNRTHELLDGLWHCGVKNYPDISPFPDGYSESVESAEGFLAGRNVSYDDILSFQRGLIDKYKPLVTVLHDFNGEYGHGAHMLNTKSFIEACENTADGNYIPEKIYVHLYNENRIALPIDEPLEAFGGKSAFNISQEAFSFHKSQHWTWFYGWIYGKGEKITSSDSISKYNPSQYGLYSCRIGEDINKNDLLENVVTYEERARIKAEEEKKAKELEEKEKKPSSETLQSSPVSHEASTLPENEKAGLSPFIFLIPVALLIILCVILTISNKKKR